MLCTTVSDNTPDWILQISQLAVLHTSSCIAQAGLPHLVELGLGEVEVRALHYLRELRVQTHTEVQHPTINLNLWVRKEGGREGKGGKGGRGGREGGEGREGGREGGRRKGREGREGGREGGRGGRGGGRGGREGEEGGREGGREQE